MTASTVRRLDAAGYRWDVVLHLVGREFRLRYRRAFFGWAWAVGQPLVRLLVLSLVFTKFLPLGIENYPQFLFAGLIAWMWFASAVASATTSAIDRRSLLFRPSLPRSSLPVVSVLTDGLDFLAALPVLAVFLIIGGGIPVTALFLPVIIAVQLLLILGIGYALCSANVYFRDVRLLLDIALLLGFYLTPVFYDASSIPDRYLWVIRLNPIARIIASYRDVLVEGKMPAAGPFLVLAVACAACFLGGYWIFRRTSPTFVDEL
jgi:lipopolysaccharide transport system permease protein